MVRPRLGGMGDGVSRRVNIIVRAYTSGHDTDGGELAESYAVENGEVKMTKPELITMIENAGFDTIQGSVT